MTVRYPNLFLAGAPKCGTTSLFNWLAQHPDIFGPVSKEPILFRRGLKMDYKTSEEDRLAIYRDWSNERFALEGTTHHFYSKTAAQEMSEVSPDAKVIIALRDPARATHSMYFQLLFTGAEELDSFEEALAAEEQRAANLAPIRRGVADTLLYSRVYSIRDNISRYLDVFGKDRVHIALLDDMKSDPIGSLDAIFDWLEIDRAPAQTISTKKLNAAKTVRSRALLDLSTNPPKPIAKIAEAVLDPITRRRIKSYLRELSKKPRPANPPMSEEIFDKLVKRHEHDIAWLEEFLDRDLAHWRQFARAKASGTETSDLAKVA